MKKIEFYLDIGFVRAVCKEIVEFDDDATEEEIDEAYNDWKDSHLNCGWREEGE